MLANIRREKGFSLYQLNLICDLNKFANEPDLEAHLRWKSHHVQECTLTQAISIYY